MTKRRVITRSGIPYPGGQTALHYLVLMKDLSGYFYNPVWFISTSYQKHFYDDKHA